ncbi:hypothetical protein ACOME3_001411 [Neoechinorhynchus agilis]
MAALMHLFIVLSLIRNHLLVFTKFTTGHGRITCKDNLFLCFCSENRRFSNQMAALMCWIIILSLIRESLLVFTELTTLVRHGSMDCFYEKIDSPQEIEFDYQVIDGGDMDITFVMFDPRRAIIAMDVKKYSQSREMNLTLVGIYKFCFDNRFSISSSKAVFFSIRSADPMLVDPPLILTGAEDSEVTNVTDFIRNAFRTVYVNLERIQAIQHLGRSKESRDKTMLSRNANRMALWSIAVMSVITTVGCLQVYFIQNLFDRHSRIRHLF